VGRGHRRRGRDALDLQPRPRERFGADAGLAFGDINATLPLLPGGSISNAGWTVGAGVEVGVVSNVSLKAEYLYVDLGNFNCGLNCGLAPGSNVTFTTNIFRGGANLRF